MSVGSHTLILGLNLAPVLLVRTLPAKLPCSGVQVHIYKRSFKKKGKHVCVCVLTSVSRDGEKDLLKSKRNTSQTFPKMAHVYNPYSKETSVSKLCANT